jgi:chromosome segregation ATPase
MKLDVNQLTLITILVLIVPTLPAAETKQKYQCWTNEDGVTECGNYVPPEYSQGGFKVFNDKGLEVKAVDRAPTPEELAQLEQQKEEERQRQEQAKKDRALLALFSTERDIEMARTAMLNTIDGQINGTETVLAGYKANLADLEKSYEKSQDNPSVSASQLQTIQTNIDNAKRRIKDTEETLQKRRTERQKVQEEYDIYTQRFRDIMKRGGVPRKKASEPQEDEDNDE